MKRSKYYNCIFFIFLIYLAKMMILALEKQRVNPRKIKSSMASIFRHGTRYAELGGRREKKINRKAYQSQQRALSSMIIRGQWDAHMGDKEKKEWITCSSALLQQNYVSKHSLFLRYRRSSVSMPEN